METIQDLSKVLGRTVQDDCNVSLAKKQVKKMNSISKYWIGLLWFNICERPLPRKEEYMGMPIHVHHGKGFLLGRCRSRCYSREIYRGLMKIHRVKWKNK